MDVNRRRPSLPAVPGRYWGAVVSTLGVVFGAVELAHARAMSAPLGIVLEAVLPFVGAVGLVAAGYVLWRQDYVYDDATTPRVVGWTAVGMAGMALIFLWMLSHQLIRGGAFHHPQFILVNNLIAGSLIGFLVGTYDARSQTYRGSVRRERLKHEFLNREIRHHVLNGMQVILGQVDLLDRRREGASPDPIAEIRTRGEEIVDRIESVRTIARAFSGEGPDPRTRQDLSTVLGHSVERVDGRYAAAEITADIPDGVAVYADRFLAAVFENLLSNAVEHNDAARPCVRVSLTARGGTAHVRIADNGPGLSDEHKSSLFTWEESSRAEVTTGVGLAIVAVLVDRYDGRVWMADNDPRGTVANVELPRAT